MRDPNLRVALHAYLAEYGPDGYDRLTFIDYVVAQTLDGMVKVDDLIAFYEMRADALRQEFGKNAKHVAAQVTTGEKKPRRTR